MADLVGPIDTAVDAVTRLRTVLHKSKQPQVRNADERALIKATAQAWFKNHRPALATLQSDSSFKAVPAKYSLLRAVRIPSKGGNTEFAHMGAAYEALDDETKALIEPLVCEHS